MESNQLSPEENPILSSPWAEPERHWDFSEDAASPILRDCRRPSQPSVAVGRLSKNAGPDIEPYRTINEIRTYVGAWRRAGFPGTCARKLLASWHDRADQDEGDLRPFFCQREAVEVLAWLFTCKHDKSAVKVHEHLKYVNAKWNDGIPRIAVKMATGTGKTRTMAMLQAVLVAMHPEGCQILVIAPNLIVSDRLLELKDLAQDSSVAPSGHSASAQIQIVNFQKFRQAGHTFSGFESPSKLHRQLLKPEIKLETEEQMLDRILDADGKHLPLYVFQDEGHHCRRDQVKNKDLRQEEVDDGGQWYKTLLALDLHRNLQAVIDFSATPAYLETPKQLKSPVFPWCVTDFSVEDAQESGICKIARIPYDFGNENEVDERLTELYDFCKSQRQPERWKSAPPPEVQTIFRMLAKHWKERRLPDYERFNRTPALIAVVNTVNNAQVLYQWLAGKRENGKWVAGAIDDFSNIDKDTLLPKDILPTLVVHSHINDNDEMNSESRRVVDEQRELRAPDAKSKDEALQTIRNLFQSVGKRNKPGEHIRCVISVAMLSEGWDAQTVTHVFGFRKFGSLLLCEQVIGRALRRVSLDDPMSVEYAEVIGVPYPGLVPVNDAERERTVNPPYDVFSRPDFSDYRLNWPKIGALHTKPPPGTRFKLDRERVREWQHTLAPDIDAELKDPLWRGESTRLSSESLHDRNHKALYALAKSLSELWLSDAEGDAIKRKGVLFVDALAAIKQWCSHPLIQISNLAPLNQENWREQLVNEVASACVSEQGLSVEVEPVWDNRMDSRRASFSHTGGFDFETTLPDRFPEDEDRECQKSELNRAACHSNAEARIASFLDSSGMVKRWVRNFRLGWRLPWWDPHTVQWRTYEPDFLVDLSTKYPCFAVIEMKGSENANSINKQQAAERWCSVVSSLNYRECRGNWNYVLVTQPDDLQTQLEDIRCNHEQK